MDEIPCFILKKALRNLPRRVLEDRVVNVCQLWRQIGHEVLSEEIHISDFCNLPPGFGDDIGRTMKHLRQIELRF